MNDDLTEASLERLAREAAKDGPIGMKVTRRIIPHEEWPLFPDQKAPHQGDFVKRIDGRLTTVDFEDCTHYVGGVHNRVVYVVPVNMQAESA